MSIPTNAQYTSYQYVNNMFSGVSAANSLPTKYVKTSFTKIHKLSMFSERYVTNSVLTEDVTASTVISNTPESRWHVEIRISREKKTLDRLSRVEWCVRALPRNWDCPRNYSCGFLDQYRVVNSRVTPSWPDDCWPQLAKLRRRHFSSLLCPFHSENVSFKLGSCFLGYLTAIYKCSG
jgi:hypothetical protein